MTAGLGVAAARGGRVGNRLVRVDDDAVRFGTAKNGLGLCLYGHI
jgi:hypothetical protein